MNLGKAEVKIDVANELGCRLDDMLEANQKDLYRLEGAVKAYQAMGLAIDGLMKIVDQEMDEGKFNLEEAAHIKRFVKRAHQMSVNLSLQTDNNRITQIGRIQGTEQAVAVAKKFKDEELAKVVSLQKALEENRVQGVNGAHEHVGDGARPVAIRPGATIKERRLAEEAATKVAKPQATEMASEEEDPPPVVVQVQEESPAEVVQEATVNGAPPVQKGRRKGKRA